jgi:hypothetical protein
MPQSFRYSTEPVTFVATVSLRFIGGYLADSASVLATHILLGVSAGHF